MFLYLEIPNHGKFVMELEDEELQRFSMCKFSYQNGDSLIDLYEDYIYIFIENMLSGINKKIILEQTNLFGKLGKWQEYYYYDFEYINEHQNEIEQMKKAIFVSLELYGVFLYEFNNKVWLEFNRGYVESYNILPSEYYENPERYRILLTQIPLA